MSIDIKPFCVSDDCSDEHNHFRTPFCVGDYVYATNTHVVIRIKRSSSDAESQLKKHKVAAKKINKWIKGFDCSFFDLIPIKYTPRIVTCYVCNGSGKWFEVEKKEKECMDCGGTGRIEEKQTIGFPNYNVQLKYVSLISQLPNIMLGFMTTNYEGQIPFVFTGGAGILMSLQNIRGVDFDLNYISLVANNRMMEQVV